jgi:lysophospholipase L1-like esterase
VTIGASDAVGVGASDPAKTGWVPLLYQMFPAGTRLINLGISGATVQDAIDAELPIAVDSDPDLIVVWLAINDIRAQIPLDTYDQNLDTLLRTLSTRTRAKIVVANVPGLTALPAFADVPAATLDAETEQWNSQISATVQRNGAALVDLAAYGSELAEHPELVSKDGFHPSDAGYKRLAAIIWDTLVTNGLIEKAPTN